MALLKGKQVKEEKVTEGTDAAVEDESVVATQEQETSDRPDAEAIAEVVDRPNAESESDRPDVIENPPSVVSGKAMAGSTGGALGALAEDGFEGLDLGFGAFPIIVLQNTGDFTSSDGAELGTEFDCVVMNSRNKFICKNTGNPKDDEDFFYSYDKEVNTSGEDVKVKIAEWKGKGWGYEWKPYLDVAAQIHGGDNDGELVMFSIPKTSITRFSGYLASVKMKEGVPPSGVVTRVYRGDKITKVKYPFFPWAFKMISVLS